MNLHEILNKPYKYSQKTNIEPEKIKGGLNSITLYNIVQKNVESNVIFNFRKLSLKKLTKLRQPDWCFFEMPDINYDDLSYYSAPLNIKGKDTKNILNETFKNLGLSLDLKDEIKITAIDFVFDSISVVSTISEFLEKQGVLYIPMFEAIKKYPKLIYRYLGSVVSINDNFFSALNSSVFSEGSFCYIPKDTCCNFDLATYFRTNTENFAQFERTLLILSENSFVSYLEGCTAPLYKESQLHVAIVEIILKEKSKVKYSTIQNWFRGTNLGEGGLYNLTTKRGLCLKKSILEWTQLEMGSALTWKYPSTILAGKYSHSEFYSVSFLSGVQEADTGGKMIHLSSNTTSKIISKSISLNSSLNIYRGLVEIGHKAYNSKNYTECSSLLVGDQALTATLPYSKVNNFSSFVQQEALISKIDALQLFFLEQRGINIKSAYTLLISGFCENICSRLPMEFAIEVPYLIFLRTKESLG